MSSELAPQYDPKQVEAAIYARWQSAGAFHAKPDDRPPARRFSVVIPPPNVTGALHLGHAINGTIQDVLVRYHRMRGDNTLWMPGIDHAGIATQAVVEKNLFEKEKITRHDLGREELVNRIWQWKEQFGSRILNQLQSIGASCDWDRTRFTLDDICARAVREAFFKLFKGGLIFRGLRLVNWDTHLQTAVADDEIYHETVKGQLTSIKYPVVDRRQGDPEYLIVATTRPETMLGDTAVAVHPEDERYKRLIGRQVQVPLVGREIPIIGDGLLVDPKFGTGVVKVTPAHDPNDYATGQRHNLPQINLLTPDGKVNGIGKGSFGGRAFSYEGLKFASEARKRVLEDLEALGLIAETKPHEHEVGHSDRSKTPIEPYLSEQWFVRMGDVDGGITLADGSKASGLAQAAIDAVTSGRVKITPERYAKSYIDWLSQKRDWCISRQLWWGHRIPVWTFVTEPAGISSISGEEALAMAHKLEKEINAVVAKKGGQTNSVSVIHSEVGDIGRRAFSIVSRDAKGTDVLDEIVLGISPHHLFDESARPSPPIAYDEIIKQIKHLSVAGSLIRDPDVLDTWFSSALWPLSTLGWPAGGTSDQPQDQLLNYFYPTSVLSTAREILSLWVARMVMFGLYLHGDIPFKQVYIHAVIQDGNGRPMKKSLGNGVDPVDIVESHGADALRYTLASMATETQDIRLPVAKDKTTGKNSSPRFDIGRNFANKIWNASRFILSNISDLTPPTAAEVQAIAHKGELSDRWIISRCNQTAASSAKLIGEFKFAELTAGLYQFFWNDLCDWYLEIAKARIKDKNPQVRIVLLFVLRQALAMLHPVMPFVTEALWEKVAPDAGVLITSPYPQADPLLDNPTAEAGMSHLQDVVRSIRDIRNQYNIDLKRQLAVTVRTADAAGSIISDNQRLIESLATAALVDIGPAVEKPANAASAILPYAQVFVADVVDRDAEKLKLLKRREELGKFLAGNRAKLSNETFVSKAPTHIVQGLKDQTAQQEQELAAVEKGLAEL